VTTQANFTSADWETLQFAPLWTFSATAGADANIDENEKAALLKELGDAPLFKEQLVREVLFSIGENLADVLTRYGNDSRSIDRGLSQVADILERDVPQQAEAFKRTMVGIGIEIAKASGPQFGSPVSPEEEAALAGVAACLRVQLN
jgi:hypothetical protein